MDKDITLLSSIDIEERARLRSSFRRSSSLYFSFFFGDICEEFCYSIARLVSVDISRLRRRKLFGLHQRPVERKLASEPRPELSWSSNPAIGLRFSDAIEQFACRQCARAHYYLRFGKHNLRRCWTACRHGQRPECLLLRKPRRDGFQFHRHYFFR